MLLRSWWPYSRLAMAFCWLQDDASISKVLAVAKQNLPLYKDDSLYWLNLGIGRVCLFQVDNTWKVRWGSCYFSFVASGIAGESSGWPKLGRHKEHANSRKWWRSWFLDIEGCLSHVFFHAAGITLKFKMIPLKTHLGLMNTIPERDHGSSSLWTWKDQTFQ